MLPRQVQAPEPALSPPSSPDYGHAPRSASPKRGACIPPPKDGDGDGAPPPAEATPTGGSSAPGPPPPKRGACTAPPNDGDGDGAPPPAAPKSWGWGHGKGYKGGRKSKNKGTQEGKGKEKQEDKDWGHPKDRERKERNDRALHRVRLCRNFPSWSCKFGDRCAFAHSLSDVVSAPKDWTRAKSHLWHQGDPLPDTETIHLVQWYQEYEMSWKSVPQWALDLLTAAAAVPPGGPNRGGSPQRGGSPKRGQPESAKSPSQSSKEECSQRGQGPKRGGSSQRGGSPKRGQPESAKSPSQSSQEESSQRGRGLKRGGSPKRGGSRKRGPSAKRARVQLRSHGRQKRAASSRGRQPPPPPRTPSSQAIPKRTERVEALKELRDKKGKVAHGKPQQQQQQQQQEEGKQDTKKHKGSRSSSSSSYSYSSTSGEEKQTRPSPKKDPETSDAESLRPAHSFPMELSLESMACSLAMLRITTASYKPLPQMGRATANLGIFGCIDRQVVVGPWLDIRGLKPSRHCLTVVAVQCHPGQFLLTEDDARKHQHTVYSSFDLSNFSMTEESLLGAMLPNCSKEIFAKLESYFQQILRASPHQSIIWFWCDDGQRSSPALATAFLMWATGCITDAIPLHVTMMKKGVAPKTFA